jgi:hypothetical protein
MGRLAEPAHARCFEEAIMTIELQGAARERRRTTADAFGAVAAPLAAILYPFTLQGFHAAAMARAGAEGAAEAAWLLAAIVALAAAFTIPAVGLIAAARLARAEPQSVAQRRGAIVALAVVAAPAIYTFLGVLDFMAGSPVPDELAFVALFASLALFVALGGPGPARARAPSAAHPALRAAHGVAALVVLGLFLGLHLVNHLAGLIGPEAHRALMKSLRLVYGSAITEPSLVALMLLLVGSGAVLAARRLTARLDGFEVFQIAAGVYLLFFVLGHMNSVFVFARIWSQPPIATDWSFATSEAWGGLIASAWSNRLIPHYWLGVFFALSHVAAGLRGVLLGHGVARGAADRVLFAGVGLAAIVASAILCGMCGLRLGT